MWCHNVTELKAGLWMRRFGSSVFCGREELLLVRTLTFLTFKIFYLPKNSKRDVHFLSWKYGHYFKFMSAKDENQVTDHWTVATLPITVNYCKHLSTPFSFVTVTHLALHSFDLFSHNGFNPVSVPYTYLFTIWTMTIRSYGWTV